MIGVVVPELSPLVGEQHQQGRKQLSSGKHLFVSNTLTNKFLWRLNQINLNFLLGNRTAQLFLPGGYRNDKKLSSNHVDAISIFIHGELTCAVNDDSCGEYAMPIGIHTFNAQWFGSAKENALNKSIEIACGTQN